VKLIRINYTRPSFRGAQKNKARRLATAGFFVAPSSYWRVAVICVIGALRVNVPPGAVWYVTV
jgi:hypothetical protein